MPQSADLASKERIFQAAAAEFAERGFDAAGVDRIAERAGVNKAMLYYHFGNKLDLYVEVTRDMFRAIGARARALADGPGTAVEKMDAWVAAIVEEASRRPWFPPIMLRELASGIPHFDEETLGLMGGIFAAVTDILAQGRREKSFRNADPLLTHITIMPAVLAYFAREKAIAARPATALLLAESRSREQFIRHMQQTVRGMLRREE
jgi:AcrR family transcriptional regulator